MFRRTPKEGILKRSKSPWCSEYVIVKKKAGDCRFCVVFRRLNNITKKDSYPLPDVQECLETLCGNKYFSNLDFASGYWQIPVEKTSQELTAFKKAGEIYEFKRLPFGLCNGTASFQRLINALFTGMRGLNVQLFLDDICLASKTWEEHIVLIDQVLKLIIKANLKLKGSKCTFGSECV